MAITMEELKRKARAYDEALEKTKMLYEKGTITESLCHIFPELKESCDREIRKDIIRNLERYIECVKDGYDAPSAKNFVIEEIEKQIAWLEKQGEQKFADKVEPKFHEGDWIISSNNKYIYQVVEVKRGIYVIRDNADNREYCVGIESADRDGRLWNISDAKDGDVLVDVYGNIGVYQRHDDFDWTSYCSLGCNGGFQNFKVEHESENAHPATKEQCDLLFQKMHEAGYEWSDKDRKLKNYMNYMEGV